MIFIIKMFSHDISLKGRLYTFSTFSAFKIHNSLCLAVGENMTRKPNSILRPSLCFAPEQSSNFATRMWCHKSMDHRYTKFCLVVPPPPSPSWVWAIKHGDHVTCACLIPSVWRWRDWSLSISIVFLFAEIKRGSPTSDELEGLSERISDKWKRLGRKLKFRKAQITEHDKSNETLYEKAYNLLTSWKERDGSDATYRVLHKALSDVERRDLAQEFCCQWKRYFCADQFPTPIPENLLP